MKKKTLSFLVGYFFILVFVVRYARKILSYINKLKPEAAETTIAENQEQ